MTEYKHARTLSDQPLVCEEAAGMLTFLTTSHPGKVILAMAPPREGKPLLYVHYSPETVMEIVAELTTLAEKAMEIAAERDEVGGHD
jgi:hypothetical protein